LTVKGGSAFQFQVEIYEAVWNAAPETVIAG
jgi:hypothetical protein